MMMVIYRKYTHTINREGFSQAEHFVLKRGDAIYDDFYANVYDKIMKPDERTDFEIEKIIEITQPSVENSVILDVGSGTGHLVDRFSRRGFRIYGVDKSAAMVKKSENNFPACEMKCGNVAANPMEFEHNTFTHILCCGFTVYSIENKNEFFRNCNHWLMANGYLVLHLVDREQFDPIIPSAKPELIENPQKYTETRITSSGADFDDFSYKAEYDFSKPQVLLKETFVDTSTKKIRQHEQTLYMESKESILQTAKLCGFIIHGQTTGYNGDDHQYLYVLERIM
jgi:SAM-dependent methyltransferase